MTNPEISIPTRAPSATSEDDTLLPFEVPALDLRGLRGASWPRRVDDDSGAARLPAPEPVAKLVGEAIVLTCLLGSR